MMQDGLNSYVGRICYCEKDFPSPRSRTSQRWQIFLSRFLPPVNCWCCCCYYFRSPSIWLNDGESLKKSLWLEIANFAVPFTQLHITWWYMNTCIGAEFSSRYRTDRRTAESASDYERSGRGSSWWYLLLGGREDARGFHCTDRNQILYLRLLYVCSTSLCWWFSALWKIPHGILSD